MFSCIHPVPAESSSPPWSACPDQSLSLKPVLPFNFIRHDKVIHEERVRQEVNLAVPVRLCISIMNNKMDREALHAMT